MVEEIKEDNTEKNSVDTLQNDESSQIIDIDLLKDRVKIMKYMLSFSYSDKKGEVRKLRRDIARILTSASSISDNK